MAISKKSNPEDISHSPFDSTDPCLAFSYNPYDGYNHLIINFATFPKDATKQDYINSLINLFNKRWKDIDCFIETGILKSRTNNKRKDVDRTKLRWKIFKRDNFTCQKCSIQECLEIDHIIPISRGGEDIEENMQTLCKRCNVKKGNKVDNAKP